MAKTINNTTARDIGAVFDVAYLSDLSAVQSALNLKIDTVEQTLSNRITPLEEWVDDNSYLAASLAPISEWFDQNSYIPDSLMSIDTWINENSYLANSITNIENAIGTAYDTAGMMSFDPQYSTHLSTAGTITDAFYSIDQWLGMTDDSMGQVMTGLQNVVDNFGQFYYESDPDEYGRTERYWSFSDPETHYLSAITGEYGNPTLTDALVALDTAIYNAGTAGAVTLSARATADDGYATTYDLHQGGVLKGSINIPKDFLVKSAALSTVTAADKAAGGKFENDSNFAVGDKYIDFVINAKDSSATAEHIYLNVKDLVDVYTAQQNATQVQLAIDANNVISATIVAGSVGTTELANSAVTTAKIADRAVTSDKIGLVDSATKKLYTLQVASGRLQLAEVAAD